MSKKVTNIVKKGKHESDSDELFNLNEEIVIGINSKKDNEKNKKKEKRKKEKETINAKTKSNKDEYVNVKKHEKVTNIKSKSDNSEYKKEKKKSHKVLKIFFVIFLLILIIVLLLLSPVFSISKISVENNVRVSSEEIISLSGIKTGENTFKYINFDMIEKIKENPYIEDVKITRKYPDEIVISVTEREPEFCLKFGESFVYIDNQGYILEITSEDFGVPEIIGYKTEITNESVSSRLNKEDLENLQNIIDVYECIENNGIADKVINFTIEDNRLVIGLVENKVAYLENFTNINIKILSLKVILERTEGKAGEINLDGQGTDSSAVFKEKV